MKDVFIVLPGYNEEKHVVSVINSVKKEGFQNIIFVDDGSVDSTFKLASGTSATVLRHKVNLGKGAAAKTGCDFALKSGANIIILMDSDGQHEAKDLKRFVKAIKNKDVVFSYRRFDKNMPFVMRLGNVFLSKFSEFLFGISIKDTQAGFRAFTSDAYKKIRWFSSNYGMESEMIARAAKHNLSYDEIQIKTIYLDAHKGTTPLDGPKVLFNMLRFKLFG